MSDINSVASSSYIFPSNLKDVSPIFMCFECKDIAEPTTIFLPSNINIQLNSSGNYGSQSNLRGVAEVVDAVTGKAVDAFGGAGKQFGAATNTTKNPNTETTFESNAVRTFQFTFKLMPKTEVDTEVIDRIVKYFYLKSFATASLGKLEYPPKWKIAYKNNGGNAKYLPKIDECYLTAVTINQNTQSNIFHANGSPQDTELSLTFQETKVQDQSELKRLENENIGFINTPLQQLKQSQKQIGSLTRGGFGGFGGFPQIGSLLSKAKDISSAASNLFR